MDAQENALMEGKLSEEQLTEAPRKARPNPETTKAKLRL